METIITSLLGSNPTLSTVALGVVVVVFAGFMTGQIVPKWITKSLLDARNERVAQANLRAEDYKRLYETEHEAAETARAQVTELLVVGQTTKKIVEAIPVAPAADGGSAS